MDEEIKNLIAEYVKHIESKEADIALLRAEIDRILSRAQQEMNDARTALDVKFEENEISEEEYLGLLRAGKEGILQRTKEKLDTLVQGMEGAIAQREKAPKAHEEKIEELRKKLDLPD